ncbi:MAG: hypothetical protein AB1610_09990 [Nitrospirota bacterium]
MYIGHYGIAFLFKKKFKEIPLWLLFISVQFVDILAFILIIFGIERIHYAPHENPFFRTTLEYFPYSHSLFTNVIFALLFLLIFWKLKNKVWGIVLSIGCISHWFIDLIFQDSNLPLFFNSYKIGFGLWKFPLISFFLEIIFVIGGGYYLYKGSNNFKRPLFLIMLMISFFSFITFMPEPELVQIKTDIKALVILIPYLIFTLLAYWIERKKFYG